MDVVKHVRAFVLADPLIAAQVATRFYPVKLPQNPTLPAITMQRITGLKYTPLKGKASLERPRYQFDVWVREGVGSSFQTSQTLGRLLADRLEGARVDVQDDTVTPAVTRRMWFEFITDSDRFEQDVNGGFYRYSADYFVWHQT